MDDPLFLGGFEIESRLEEHHAGVVHAGRDRHGRGAAIAVLHPAAGTFPPSGSGAGGMVATLKCPNACEKADRRKLCEHVVVDEDDWRRTDPTTVYAEIEGDLKGERRVRVAMVHVFAVEPGGRPGTAVIVQLTGPPGQKATMQKLINEIRARTP